MKAAALALVLAALLGACAPAARPPTLSTPLDTESAIASGNPPRFLYELAKEHYSDSELQQRDLPLTFTVELASTDRAMWGVGWCAKTQAILEDNLEQIVMAFWINGQPVPLEQFYIQQEGTGCSTWQMVVSNWPKGVTTLKQEMTLANPINDGWNQFDAGQHMVHIFEVTVP